MPARRRSFPRLAAGAGRGRARPRGAAGPGRPDARSSWARGETAASLRAGLPAVSTAGAARLHRPDAPWRSQRSAAAPGAGRGRRDCCRCPATSTDPLHEADAREAPGLLHKYHGRALLITTGACAVHCRYCFRRHYDYGAGPVRRSGARWSAALEHIASDASDRGNHPQRRRSAVAGQSATGRPAARTGCAATIAAHPHPHAHAHRAAFAGRPRTAGCPGCHRATSWSSWCMPTTRRKSTPTTSAALRQLQSASTAAAQPVSAAGGRQ